MVCERMTRANWKSILMLISNCLLGCGLILSVFGCGGRVAAPVECQVVVVQGKDDNRVKVVAFESLCRFVRVAGTWFVSGNDAPGQLKLYDLEGAPWLCGNWCKTVKDAGRLFADIERRCKDEAVDPEHKDYTVCVRFYPDNAVPRTYAVRTELYKEILDELIANVNNAAEVESCLEVADMPGCRMFPSTRSVGTEIVDVPYAAVLVSRDRERLSPACVFYSGDVNPVRHSPLWVFGCIYFPIERVRMKQETTIDEFREMVESKKKEYIKNRSSDSAWKFRLVCWYKAAPSVRVVSSPRETRIGNAEVIR